VKPSASSRGRGIHLLRSTDSPPADAGVVQVYIERPLLITGRKFDIRLYTFVPTIFPLRVYLHESGLARFCTHPYAPDGDVDDLQMHLTNFSLNKQDGAFHRASGPEAVEDSKWSLAFWANYMERTLGVPVRPLMDAFEKLVVTTVIAGICEIRKTHRKHIGHRHTSFELYGLDAMLDVDLNVYLIEINISPSMSGLDSKLDHDLKFRLNLDVLRMARIIECDPKQTDPCPEIRIVDEKCAESMTTERIEAVLGGADPWANPTFADFTIVRDYLEETEIESGFRLVYPRAEELEAYKPCFDEMCYEDIVFNAWVAMPNARKEDVLKRHGKRYTAVIDEIMRVKFGDDF
jgi:tubulin polyglutamylase TTLL4